MGLQTTLCHVVFVLQIIEHRYVIDPTTTVGGCAGGATFFALLMCPCCALAFSGHMVGELSR